LYLWNIKFYSSLIKDFYKDIFLYSDRVNLFWGSFKEAALVYLNYTIESKLKYKLEERVKTLEYNYNKNDKILVLSIFIALSSNEEYIPIERNEGLEKKLNEDLLLKEKVKELLEFYYEYNGKFIIDTDALPF
jgi:hypothetical protein